MTNAAAGAPSLLDRCRTVMGDGDVARALRIVTAARQQAKIEPSDPVADAVAALLAGGDVDTLTGLGDALHDQLQDWERQQHHLDGLNKVAKRLQDHSRDLAKGGADRALALLRDELTALLDAAEPIVAELAIADSADEAIATGVAAEWKQARQIAASHAEIRRVQAIIVGSVIDRPDVQPDRAALTLKNTALPSTQRLVLTYGTISDFARRYPNGYLPHVEEPSGTNITQVERRDAPKATELPWHTGDGIADLKWLTAHRDVVWVPSMSDLLSAQRTAEQTIADVLERKFLAGLFARGAAASEKARQA